MTPDDLSLISAFLMGVFGAPHCAGMCGGIVGAFAMRSSGLESDSKSRLLVQLNYNLGRITTYALFGFLVGLIGMSLHNMVPLIGEVMRLAAGLLMICMGLYIGGWWLGLRHLESFGFRLWRPVQNILMVNLRIAPALEGYAAGLIWGFLPCGLVYTLLTVAMTTADGLKGSLVMISFGLGTFPTLFLASIFADRLASVVRRKAIRSMMASLVMLFGAWTLAGVVGVIDHANHDAGVHQNELK